MPPASPLPGCATGEVCIDTNAMRSIRGLLPLCHGTVEAWLSRPPFRARPSRRIRGAGCRGIRWLRTILLHPVIARPGLLVRDGVRVRLGCGARAVPRVAGEGGVIVARRVAEVGVRSRRHDDRRGLPHVGQRVAGHPRSMKRCIARSGRSTGCASSRSTSPPGRMPSATASRSKPGSKLGGYVGGR